jgi:predicted acylesterase/phospholipase RssA
VNELRILAGPRARQRIAADGLQAAQISAIAGAAGGPKGLALIPLDRYVFGDWLASAPRPRALFGASIGAWRMAAAAQRAPVPALDRLETAYLELQRYPESPGPRLVSQVCRDIVRAVIGADARGFVHGLDTDRHLHLVTAHGLGPRLRSTRGRFVRAAAANLLSRERLGAHLQRVVFVSAGPGLHAATATDLSSACPARTANDWNDATDRAGAPLSQAVPVDRFATRAVALDAANLEDALLASGSIPLVADPVRSIDGAPAGDYWDGGLIDYHLYWPFARLDGLVLYPHFTPHLTAGWLDKFLPWRRYGIGPAGAGWLDNVVLLAPGPGLLARLPNRKLPDRSDFHRYGLDHDRRLRDWRGAIAECTRMAEAFARFVERPDPALVEPI